MYSLWDSQWHSSFFQTLFLSVEYFSIFLWWHKIQSCWPFSQMFEHHAFRFFPPTEIVLLCLSPLDFFFFYHIHTYFQLCTDANGGISSVFHTFHGFPGVTWEVLCFLEPRSFHGCALCRGRVFRQLEHLRAAGRLHETQAACGAFTYPSSFTVVMQSSPFKAFTHRLLLAVNASAEMFVPYF